MAKKRDKRDKRDEFDSLRKFWRDQNQGQKHWPDFEPDRGPVTRPSQKKFFEEESTSFAATWVKDDDATRRVLSALHRLGEVLEISHQLRNVQTPYGFIPSKYQREMSCRLITRREWTLNALRAELSPLVNDPRVKLHVFYYTGPGRDRGKDPTPPPPPTPATSRRRPKYLPA